MNAHSHLWDISCFNCFCNQVVFVSVFLDSFHTSFMLLSCPISMDTCSLYSFHCFIYVCLGIYFCLSVFFDRRSIWHRQVVIVKKIIWDYWNHFNLIQVLLRHIWCFTGSLLWCGITVLDWLHLQGWRAYTPGVWIPRLCTFIRPIFCLCFHFKFN